MQVLWLLQVLLHPAQPTGVLLHLLKDLTLIIPSCCVLPTIEPGGQGSLWGASLPLGLLRARASLLAFYITSLSCEANSHQEEEKPHSDKVSDVHTLHWRMLLAPKCMRTKIYKVKLLK